MVNPTYFPVNVKHCEPSAKASGPRVLPEGHVGVAYHYQRNTLRGDRLPPGHSTQRYSHKAQPKPGPTACVVPYVASPRHAALILPKAYGCHLDVVVRRCVVNDSNRSVHL